MPPNMVGRRRIQGRRHARPKTAPARHPACDPACFVLSILCLEVAFKLSTTGGFWPELLFVVPLSMSLGCLLWLLSSLPAPPTASFVVRTCVLAMFGLMFVVEYFVYREFKVFYDPATILAGAGGIAMQFGGTAASLVLSPSGVMHLVVFFLPAAGYATAARRFVRPDEADTPFPRRRIAAVGLASYLFATVLLSSLDAYGKIYTTRYSFDRATASFGLLSATTRDALEMLAGESPAAGFVTEAKPNETHKSLKEIASRQIDYGKNALEIDFAALASGASDVHAQLDSYVSCLEPSSKNMHTGDFAGFNLIFVSAEAFSAEAIREDVTPTLSRLATRGIQFTDYYQFDTAGTTGGECANLFGLLATEGGASVKGTATYDNHMTMGNALDRLGYNGWAFHNNTYTYYDRHLTHNNLGYSNGFMGYGNGMERWVAWQWPQSDLEMIQGTFEDLYASAEPFDVYYMSVSGHSDYSISDNAMSAKNWDRVSNLANSDPVKAYLAANVELECAMEYLVGQLEERGMADHTVIVIAADHFPYGLDDDGALGQLPYTSELYGYDVENLFQRDHNRLVIWSGALERHEPLVVDTPTSSIDILPTLSNLFGIEWDSRLLPGRDVFSDARPLVFNLNYDWKTELGTYFASSGTFVPVEGVDIPDGYVDATNAIVANKIRYCHAVLTSDYYRHVFAGSP